MNTKFFVVAALTAVTTLGSAAAFASEATQFALDTAAPLSRAQIKAETLEAIRIGAIGRHEKNSFPSAAQLESIRQAGERAVAMRVVSR